MSSVLLDPRGSYPKAGQTVCRAEHAATLAWKNVVQSQVVKGKWHKRMSVGHSWTHPLICWLASFPDAFNWYTPEN